uniref:NAD(P)-binding domain-containing protein n=2 Tax=Odontella aurita TaxID=265563 RepID=A0A7S4NGZ4_9STRA|mmetsp:Transcript_7756/g.22807  ORF Transcript_7756/g.22807 Transcript_7756/m.22807 type:complete len:312 (+) Transcript_7756:286-1221(+)|eukprot:CAMPEP_0113543232 /NCGR_PEP_ID=MMETSP0015_2-20120614/10046_1 /TAXON_ID=2838 /ORGANISM="Odontella" /LENGTH=311 /DNA_ID=CAMNT_0000443373 /DNA_START=222 /DNA_END=1157 /DNA_ORIENTATION=+ /assembly_acc=CAM_ASM_000160
MTKILILFSLAAVPLVCGFAGDLGRKVVVTGAAGRTGKLVFSLLTESPEFDAVGLVRTEKSAKRVMKEVKCGLDHVIVSDVTQLSSNAENGIPRGLNGAEAMIICTSAVPYISKLSVIKAMMNIPVNVLSGKKALNPRDFRFRFRPDQYPEKVDYLGQVTQIDLAKKLGIRHVVVVSSMGGTNSENFLNSIGKDKNGDGNGDILLWKRKAERYLTESGLQYTIIHPGGLVDTPPGEKEFVLDIDDKLLEHENRSISRADVARLCVASLSVGKGRCASFDVISRDGEDSRLKPAEDVLDDFLQTGKTADYSL